jgi:hypothetical protein
MVIAAAPSAFSAEKKAKPAPALKEATPEPGPPYEFRGATLGMTLLELKAMPYPEGSTGPLGSYGSSVLLRCTSEIRDNSFDPLSVSKEDAAVGAIECRWMRPPNRDEYNYSWDEASVIVGDKPAKALAYKFFPIDGELRLRSIVVVTGTAQFPTIVAALTGKYGAPGKVTQGEVQNRAGNTFSATEVKWDNVTSSIEVVERSGQVDEMVLLYMHAELNAAYSREYEAKKGPPKI